MSDTTRPVELEFVNFDGRLSGETARTAKAVADLRGWTVHRLMAHCLALGLSHVAMTLDQANDSPELVKSLWATTKEPKGIEVKPMTINTGNGGFHVVTVVADGYGSLVAENSQGDELVRVKAAEEPVTDRAADLKQLMDEFVKLSD